MGLRVCVQVTVSLIVKDYLQNVDAMRDLFFSSSTDEASLSRYQGLLNEYSTPMQVLDLKLLRVWPSASRTVGPLITVAR